MGKYEQLLVSVAEFIDIAGPLVNGELGEKVSEDWLQEQIKITKNLTEIALLLIDFNRRDLLPTILELMFLEIQQINDDACVVRDDKD